MWAQLIRTRVKPGQEDEVRRLPQEIDARWPDNSTRPQRLMFLQNQNDPGEYYTLVVFESEAKARENERSPEQAERLQRLQQVFDGPPEYVDLNVVYDGSR